MDEGGQQGVGMNWFFSAAILFMPAIVFFAAITDLRDRLRLAALLFMTALLVVPYIYPLLPSSNLIELGSENAMTAQAVIWALAVLLTLSSIVGCVAGLLVLHFKRSNPAGINAE